ncbi:hypothetical protein [Pseudomonas cannabina]|uniref:HrpA n=1 Tax=Pseudomonas cannabina TaxID=86840 RepID=A0A0P9LJU4_PSECA|nr:hypothetical protein [Pseudomonas cannabina]KAA8712065.1 hypothetical protein F4W70_12025 [Pseudomonas cannabina]KPW78065.1 Unknown protein sequence [Pseudomonas cannabina]SDQ49749.1 HrpA pilus formation protein [Pseudomonas cannabina]
MAGKVDRNNQTNYDTSKMPSGHVNDESVTAQQDANKTLDITQASLIKLQTAEQVRKMKMDTMNLIASGKQDSANKIMSSMAKTASGINF